MERRNFLRSAALSGIALSGMTGMMSANASQTVASNEAKFKLKYAPHFGMFKNSAGEDLIDQIKFMADQGFTAFEDNGMMGRDIATQEKIGKTLADLNMTMGVFVVEKGGNMSNTLAAGKSEFVDIFLDGCRRAVDVAKRVNAKWMTVVPGGFERRLPIGIQDANVIEALRRGAEILEPHGLVMVLEPLNTIRDHPGLFLTGIPQSYQLCRSVNRPSCKIVNDMYHQQITEGNILPNIDAAWSEIASFHVGDNPGRREPTTGEINYKNVFRHIHSKGYDGVLCMEHGRSLPGKEGEARVIAAYREVDSFIL
jgi:hydroxypyruvate isomerase